MRHIFIAFAACFTFAVSIQAYALTIDEKVEALLAKMTLEEKAGQLNQYSGYEIITGDIDESKISQRNLLVKKGLVGSVLNVLGTKDVEKAQRYAAIALSSLFPLPRRLAGILKRWSALLALPQLKRRLLDKTGPLRQWLIFLMTPDGVA